LHPYPLVRGGGLFLLLVGAGITSGAFWPQARRRLLGWSLALASVVTALFAARLARPFGLPTALQIGVLVGAVLMEGVVIGLVVRQLQQQDDRTVELAVMFVVGVHFLPMTLAFGPLVGVLGVLVVLNAAAGLWLARGTDLLVFWTADGLSKMLFGGIMLFIALT
jgi:hypothetical protein